MICLICIPTMGYWATAIGYVTSVVLGTGLFMNWYYHTRIGLDMVYFWKNMLPTIGLALGVTTVCLLGTHSLPVNSILMFLVWGVIYSILFLSGAMKVSLTGKEREKVISRIKRKAIQ